MIRVLVSAKSAIEQAGLESIVRTGPDFEISVASRPREILTAAREADPDVILVDSPGVSLIRQLAELAPQTFAPPVVGLIEQAARTEISRLLQSGVRGLLTRDSEPQEILAALRAVHDGLAVVSPEILDVLLPVQHELGDAEELPPVEALTARESEVLGLLAAGAGNKEIAAKLHISEHTAKFHVSSILSKLGAASRTEAVTRGYRQGLILI